MKKILLVSGLLFTCLFGARAEYSGWFIKFKIYTSLNQEIEGHVYVTGAYFEPDSASSKAYLIEQFDVLDHDRNDTISFFQDRIRYEYQIGEGPDMGVIYTLVNNGIIETDKIKDIEVTELIDFGYLSGISNELTLKDTSWLKTKPVDRYFFVGSFCEYEIFIHERSEQADSIINLIENVANPNKGEMKAGEENGGEFDSENDVDGQLYDLIQKFNGLKVVVIGTCSC